MSFCDRIEEWAYYVGIDDWAERLKLWASDEMSWNEYCEMEFMTMDFEFNEVLAILKEFAELPNLQEMDDCELGRWVAEKNGFSWTDSIDELVEDEEKAFNDAKIYMLNLEGVIWLEDE